VKTPCAILSLALLQLLSAIPLGAETPAAGVEAIQGVELSKLPLPEGARMVVEPGERGRILLWKGAEVLDLASGRILAAAPSLSGKGPEQLLCDWNGNRWQVSAGRAGLLAPGSAKLPITLPSGAKRIAFVRADGTSEQLLYAYGGSAGKGMVWTYGGGGKFRLLLEGPAPIRGLVPFGHRLVFATGGAVYSYAPGGGVKLVFESPLIADIQSLAVDEKRDVLFVSTPSQVFSVRAGTAELLLNGAGGELVLQGPDRLMVSNKDAGAFILLRGLASLLAVPSP
jgi:hypothetical protein